MAAINQTQKAITVVEAEEIWAAAGRNPDEMSYLMRVLAEKALLSAIRPTEEQLARWQVACDGKHQLVRHIYQVSGLIVDFKCLERLWRYFTQSPRPRQPSTLVDFARCVPEKISCRYCESEVGPFHIDHITPLAKGGEDATDNLSFLCQVCNQQKGTALDPYTPYFSFL